MSCVPMRKDGVPEFVIKAYIVVQWCSDTICEITSVVMVGDMYTKSHCHRYHH